MLFRNICSKTCSQLDSIWHQDCTNDSVRQMVFAYILGHFAFRWYFNLYLLLRGSVVVLAPFRILVVRWLLGLVHNMGFI